MGGWDTLISCNFLFDLNLIKHDIINRIIDNKNTKSFEHKKNKLLSAIFKVIGKPHAKKLRYKRKFILDLRYFFSL